MTARQMSARQAAEFLGMGRTQFAKAVDAGDIPVWRVTDSGRRVFRVDIIEAHGRRLGELHAERAAS